MRRISLREFGSIQLLPPNAVGAEFPGAAFGVIRGAVPLGIHAQRPYRFRQRFPNVEEPRRGTGWVSWSHGRREVASKDSGAHDGEGAGCVPDQLAVPRPSVGLGERDLATDP
jgi:hypothetical protein